jgi:hypothetical protein
MTTPPKVTRESFMSTAAPSVQYVEDGGVYVRELTIAAALPLRDLSELTLPERIVAIIIACACDENGHSLFTADDADVIANLPSKRSQAIAQAAMDANGLGKDDDDPNE